MAGRQTLPLAALTPEEKQQIFIETSQLLEAKG